MKMIKFFSMAALALAMTACSNSDDFDVQQPVQNASGKVQFTATIAAPTDGGMRTAYTEDAGAIKVEWKEGDKIAVLNSSDNKRDVVTVKSVNADGSAVIEGEITSPSESGIKVNLFYPASLVNANGSMDFSVYTGGTLDGTLASIAANADFRYAANCALDTSGDNVTLKDQVKLESQIAIWKLTLQDGSSNSINATALTVQYGSRSTKVTPASATDVLYVPVIIVSDTDVSITATTASGDYAYSKSGVTLAKGKYYESTVTMAKTLDYPIALSEVTSPYVGSVVADDGNVYKPKTAVADGKTAVGILGKVTGTGQGLILALQDATNQTWNTIEDEWGASYYAGTTLKVLPDDAARGSLTSYTTLGSTTVSNWAVGQKADYEAIFQNLGSKQSDNDGTTYDANVNAYITTGVGGTAISGKNWVATENSDATKGWLFQSAYWDYDLKVQSLKVRPVLGF